MNLKCILRVLKVFFLIHFFFIVINSTNTSIITHNVIHNNGLKEFVILKEIKKNKCTCSCNCMPRAILPDIDQLPVPSIPFEYQSSSKNKKCSL